MAWCCLKARPLHALSSMRACLGGNRACVRVQGESNYDSRGDRSTSDPHWLADDDPCKRRRVDVSASEPGPGTSADMQTILARVAAANMAPCVPGAADGAAGECSAPRAAERSAAAPALAEQQRGPGLPAGSDAPAGGLIGAAPQQPSDMQGIVAGSAREPARARSPARALRQCIDMQGVTGGQPGGQGRGVVQDGGRAEPGARASALAGAPAGDGGPGPGGRRAGAHSRLHPASLGGGGAPPVMHPLRGTERASMHCLEARPPKGGCAV